MKHLLLGIALVIATSIGFSATPQDGGPPFPYNEIIGSVENPKPQKLSGFGDYISVIGDKLYVSANVDKTGGVVFYSYNVDKLNKRRKALKNDKIGLRILQRLYDGNANPEVHTSNLWIFSEPYGTLFPGSLEAIGSVTIFDHNTYQWSRVWHNPSLKLDPVIIADPSLAEYSYFGRSIDTYGEQLLFVGHPGFRHVHGQSPGKVWVIDISSVPGPQPEAS